MKQMAASRAVQIRRAWLVYLPVGVWLVVALFPLLWMALTSVTSDAGMVTARSAGIPTFRPTLAHYRHLLLETPFPRWVWNTCLIAGGATAIALVASVCLAFAVQRLRSSGARWVAVATFAAYLIPPTVLFLPMARVVATLGLQDSRLALIFIYPTFLLPFATWLLIGYFKSIPASLEDSARVDGATDMQFVFKILLPLAAPGVTAAAIYCFALAWNEFIYALTILSSTSSMTVPVGLLTELVAGDVYQWGALMGGALLGSLPVAILYGLLVRYYMMAIVQSHQ